MRHEWFANGVMLGYRYDGSPIVWADGTPAPPDESHPYIADRPARRPRARMSGSTTAARRSTCYGRGFVLLRLGDNPPSGTSIEQAAQQRGVPLTCDRARRAEGARGL